MFGPDWNMPDGRPLLTLGLDLGQQHESTALAVVERVWAERHGSPVPDVNQAFFHIRHLQRWQIGTPYPQVIEDVGGILRSRPLAAARCRLVLDGTAVGKPVTDMFQRAGWETGMFPVRITAGDLEGHAGGFYRIPKQVLVSLIQVGLQTGHLKIAATLEEAETLTRELREFRARVSLTETDNVAESWRAGRNDDLVLATALALWAARRAEPKVTALNL